MNMFQLYYYASIPLATNLLFYSVTSLSTSISSSQNVVKFITEHKDCDSVVFKNEIMDSDLEMKLRVVESLIYDILRKHSVNAKEFECVKREIETPGIGIVVVDNCEGGSGVGGGDDDGSGSDFTGIELSTKEVGTVSVLNRIDEPIKIAIVSTADTLRIISGVLAEVRKKIESHNNSYMKNFVSLSLKTELSTLHKQTKILEHRTHLLFELLKVYLPLAKKRKT